MSNIPEIKDLQSLLEKYYNKKLEIIQHNVKMLTEPGENYGSVILAVDVTLKIGNEILEKNIVAKMCPANEMLCDIFNIQESFKKELNMYVFAIPALTKLEQEFGITDNKIEDMFAKCLGGRINLSGSTKVEKDAVILLENIKILGYNVGDRLTGFNLQQTELIIGNLAQFHAVPIALKFLKPKIFEEKVLPGVKGIMLGDALNKDNAEFMIEEVLEVLRTDGICNKNIDRIYKSMQYNLLGPYRSNKPRQPFATIVHSDYWTNNTMILTKNGKAIHNKIVDLQLPMYNSGIHDLLFFMFSSVIPSVLETNLDHFIKLYYDNFIERLSKYGIDLSPFSWQAFNEEILKTGPLELGHTLIMFKPILTKRGIIEDMSKFDASVICNKDIVSEDFNTRIINTCLKYIDRKWI